MRFAALHLQLGERDTSVASVWKRATTSQRAHRRGSRALRALRLATTRLSALLRPEPGCPRWRNLPACPGPLPAQLLHCAQLGSVVLVEVAVVEVAVVEVAVVEVAVVEVAAWWVSGVPPR